MTEEKKTPRGLQLTPFDPAYLEDPYPVLRSLREQDPFVFLSVGGLLGMFGLQALINIAVNLNLLPAKGMTLPFISYGGSSLVSLAMAMGMVLALTRRSNAESAWHRGQP